MKSQISIKKNLIQYKNRLSQNPFSKIFKQNIIQLIKNTNYQPLIKMKVKIFLILRLNISLNQMNQHILLRLINNRI